jgi:beta-mannosidase
VASWSSIEFTGRWRALHYVARRFFAPALVTGQLGGDETTIIGNYRRSSVHAVNLYTVYDAPGAASGVLRWDVFHLDGRSLRNGRKPVVLRHGESVLQHTIDLGKLRAKHSRESLYVRIALEIAGERVSEDTVFLVAPRFVELPRARTAVSLKLTSARTATIRFRSTAFQHRFAFDFPGLAHLSSDNFMELYPGEAKMVTVTFSTNQTVARLKKRLTFSSLVDSY